MSDRITRDIVRRQEVADLIAAAPPGRPILNTPHAMCLWMAYLNGDYQPTFQPCGSDHFGLLPGESA